MRVYAKFAILAVAIVGVLIWLAAGGVSETKTYYKTIAELNAMGDRAHSERLRVGGDIEPGSIQRSSTGVTFTLTQDSRKLKVVYTGVDPLPDTFKDGSQALADGRLGADGVFQAGKIQAKCASKYEAKPEPRRAGL
ncbi:MAG TPA: cytochrome c maturation protein CcmE [Bryobacteraceae bacterium]|nr:cytochrome c maturation protein CcmE [Bryobacteraceae bacterium]